MKEHLSFFMIPATQTQVSAQTLSGPPLNPTVLPYFSMSLSSLTAKLAFLKQYKSPVILLLKNFNISIFLHKNKNSSAPYPSLPHLS